jgi:hypothetical protein
MLLKDTPHTHTDYRAGEDIGALSKGFPFPRVEVVASPGVSEVAGYATDEDALEALRKILGTGPWAHAFKHGWYDITPAGSNLGRLDVAAFGYDRSSREVYFITREGLRLYPDREPAPDLPSGSIEGEVAAIEALAAQTGGLIAVSELPPEALRASGGSDAD